MFYASCINHYVSPQFITAMKFMCFRFSYIVLKYWEMQKKRRMVRDGTEHADIIDLLALIEVGE